VLLGGLQDGVMVAKACAPHADRKPPFTFRWTTDLHNARSEPLLSAGTSGRCRKSMAMLQIALAQALSGACAGRYGQELIAGSFNGFDLPSENVQQ